MRLEFRVAFVIFFFSHSSLEDLWLWWFCMALFLCEALDHSVFFGDAVGGRLLLCGNLLGRCFLRFGGCRIGRFVFHRRRLAMSGFLPGVGFALR